MGKKLFENVKSQFKLKNYVSAIIVAVIVIIAGTMQYLGALKTSSADLLALIGYSIILAVSLNLVVGFLGELSLGHAGFMCIGAYFGTYLSNILYESYDLAPIVILLITMILSGILAAIFGFIIGLPALRLKGDYLAIVTLAFGEIVRTLCMNFSFFGGAKGLRNPNVYESDLFVIIGVFAVITIVLVQNFIRSKHGRAVMAIRDNEIAARAMGVNVTKYKLVIFVFSAFFAGVAGVFYGACTTPIRYDVFSYNYSIEILVMVVFGGMGNLGGSIIAATFIPIVNYFLQDKLSSFAAFKLIIYALLLIGIVIYTNAPKLKGFRQKYNFGKLWIFIKSKIRKLFTKKEKLVDPSVETENGKADWTNIPTKIEMDAILSTDFKVDTAYTPDKGKGDK